SFFILFTRAARWRLLSASNDPLVTANKCKLSFGYCRSNHDTTAACSWLSVGNFLLTCDTPLLPASPLRVFFPWTSPRTWPRTTETNFFLFLFWCLQVSSGQTRQNYLGRRVCRLTPDDGRSKG